MWLYIRGQLVNLDYAYWVSPGEGTIKGKLGKNAQLCIAITGEERPITVDFDTPKERDDVLQTLAAYLCDTEDDSEDAAVEFEDEA